MTKCVICERRPAIREGFCGICADKINSEQSHRQTVQALHFLTYQGHVVGLFPVGGGELRPRLLRRKVELLPKRKTLDLNHYCDGFERVKIKAFKACVLHLAHV